MSAEVHGHGEKLTRKGHAAIAALLESDSIRGAAASCNLSEKTLRRWLDRPDFAHAYQAAACDVYALAIARLRSRTLKAVTTLDLAMDGKASPLRVAAARAVLDCATRSPLRDGRPADELTEAEARRALAAILGCAPSELPASDTEHNGNGHHTPPEAL